MNHTPGPWNILHQDNHLFIQWEGLHLGTMMLEQDANIVAAAPDLLAALRVAIAHLEGDGFCCDDIIETGNAAIAKAEGKP